MLQLKICNFWVGNFWAFIIIAMMVIVICFCCKLPPHQSAPSGLPLLHLCQISIRVCTLPNMYLQNMYVFAKYAFI